MEYLLISWRQQGNNNTTKQLDDIVSNSFSTFNKTILFLKLEKSLVLESKLYIKNQKVFKSTELRFW